MSDHVLHVRPDDGERHYTVTCPADRDDMTRPCVAWQECSHPTTDEDRDRLADVEEEPCPDGAEGIAHHREIGGMICHPQRACIVAISDFLPDAAEELDLAPGDYAVGWEIEDFTWLSLHLSFPPSPGQDGGA